jgi:phage-related protein
MTVALPSPDLLDSMDVDPSFDVRRARLGDGFERLAVGGLNSVREVYRVRWALQSAADANVIYDALKGTLGTEEITFTPPDRVTEQSFTLVGLPKKVNPPLNTIVEATLRERFLP